MNSVTLPKSKLLKVKIFAALFLAVGVIGAFQSLVGLVILLIGILLFAIQEQLLFPNYISIMGQSFSTRNDFSTVSALGSSSEYDYYVIRFFDENNRNEIVFKTKNKSEILQKGNQLSELLYVDLLNRIDN